MDEQKFIVSITGLRFTGLRKQQVERIETEVYWFMKRLRLEHPLDPEIIVEPQDELLAESVMDRTFRQTLRQHGLTTLDAIAAHSPGELLALSGISYGRVDYVIRKLRHYRARLRQPALNEPIEGLGLEPPINRELHVTGIDNVGKLLERWWEIEARLDHTVKQRLEDLGYQLPEPPPYEPHPDDWLGR